MGHSEPCRAQLAMISRVVLRESQYAARDSTCLLYAMTYKAYCTTPFVPSWLGRGTSLCSFPVLRLVIDGGGVGLPLTMPGFPMTGSAGFEVVDDMKAALAALNGWRAVIGLAEEWCQFDAAECSGGGTYRAAPTRSPAVLSRTWLQT